MRKRRIDTARIVDQSYQEKLQLKMAAALSNGPDGDLAPDQHWKALSSTIFSTAVEVLGYTTRKNADWFNEHDRQIRTLIHQRNAALRAKQSNPNPRNDEKLKEARSVLQRNLRGMENTWWLRKCREKLT